MSTSKALRAVVVASAFAAVIVTADTAEANRNAFGIRGGLTDDVDTVFFGAHGAVHLRGAPKLRLEPSLELGFGDAVDFALRFNLNFKYMIVLGRRQAVYPLFGPAVYHVEFDPGGDDTEVGLNLGGGFALHGFTFDLALGVADIPDLTFTVGYTFW